MFTFLSVRDVVVVSGVQRHFEAKIHSDERKEEEEEEKRESYLFIYWILGSFYDWQRFDNIFIHVCVCVCSK